MSNRYFISSTTLYVFDGKGVSEFIEVPEYDEETETVEEIEIQEVKPKKKSGRGLGVRHCKSCGKVGHRSDRCPNKIITEKIESPKNKDDDEEYSSDSTNVSEEDLVADIKSMWVEKGQSAYSVCIDLRIPLGRFNYLVKKYDIVKL